MPSPPPIGPALALLDIGDIPHGLRSLDALAKEATVEVLAAGTIHDGRYLVMFAGEVEPVQRAHERAVAAAGPTLFDTVLLPWADERIAPTILDGRKHAHARGDTLGVMQLDGCPTLVRALDAALKGAVVDLVQLRIGDGLGGRAIATVRGESHDVDAALELGQRAAKGGRPDGWSAVSIRNADDAVSAFGGGQFHKEWRG